MIDIMALLVTGAGFFIVLTKYNVPEVANSFWNGNPFLVKRESTETTMNWIFTTFGICGVLMKIFTEIFGENLVSRAYSPPYYFRFFVITLFVVLLILIVLTSLGKFIAKRFWYPQITQICDNSFQHYKTIILNDGLSDKQLEDSDKHKENHELKNQNMKRAREYIFLLEKLLDIRVLDYDLEQRVETLQKHFNGAGYRPSYKR